MNSSIQALLNDFVEGLYADGTVDRWKRENAERKVISGEYDRAAIMRSAWAFRKGEGLTMSEAMKRAWADARRANLRLVA